MKGFLRADGRKGIRNIVVVAYLVECANHVAKMIVTKMDNDDVQLIGFPGCYPNDYSLNMLEKICTHPNVGGVVLVSLGCEGFNREKLTETVINSGRTIETVVIQQCDGISPSINLGVEKSSIILASISKMKLVDMTISDLVVGTICNGSDSTNGISANPAVGACFDMLLDDDATCVFEETGRLIGYEDTLDEIAEFTIQSQVLSTCAEKTGEYFTQMGYGSFALGNIEDGLTIQEEQYMGAYTKSDASNIKSKKMIESNSVVHKKDNPLIQVVSDNKTPASFPNISDNAEIVEIIASGALVILFTTGEGSTIGSAISPVIKICANPETYQSLHEDMDVNAGSIIEGKTSVNEIGQTIFDCVIDIASGSKSKSEALGHKGFILNYNRFDINDSSKALQALDPYCLR